ncbi:hypothetical protein [Nostoc sp.]|uniref:hypothetical protein n=1 Tax=Nostoc sp. TaxID=1180 RepID=UPI002FF71A8B
MLTKNIIFWLKRPKGLLYRIWEKFHPNKPWLCPGTVEFCEMHLTQDLRNCHKQWRGYTAPRAKELHDKHGNSRTFELLN